jgi:hypothetical protein
MFLMGWLVLWAGSGVRLSPDGSFQDDCNQGICEFLLDWE